VIQRLPDDVVDQIKAGEVVERPASIVKELVENAIDAGARRVEVEIEAGGKQLVRVHDDGCGMSREDALLALERHATSKLHTAADLTSIATRGFRGEALPAIASVSQLLLRTRATDDESGTEIEVHHGAQVSIRDTGHPRGTTIEIRDLFGSVPARRKFLRADSTEAGHVAETMTQMALPRWDTGFFVKAGARRSLEAPAVADLAARIYQLFGDAFLENQVAVESQLDWVEVQGFVSRPDRPSARRPTLRLFVNDRPIRDRGLVRAVAEGCRAAGASDRLDALLLIRIPPDLVDVNVHPAKSEVRFAEARTVWIAVENAVRDAISREARTHVPVADTAHLRESGLADHGAASSSSDFGSRGVSGSYGGESPVREAVDRYLTTNTGAVARVRTHAGSGTGVRNVNGAEHPSDEDSVSRERVVLGQHRTTYIIVSDGEDLLLVDQHTAHERARFERLLDGMQKRNVPSQRLLVPIVAPLSPKLRPVLDDQASALEALGFEVESFGGDSLRVSALPELLGSRDPSQAVEALLEEFLERESNEWAVSTQRERLAATLACHSAVRAGQALGHAQMQAIVAELGETRHPTLCPHGRPTMVRIPRSDVSRWFGRSGWGRQ
jgi:DNA mismatch repair protein MutL